MSQLVPANSRQERTAAARPPLRRKSRWADQWSTIGSYEMGVELPSREAAIGIIRDARARVDELIGALSDSDVEATATLGGGNWSIKDLIGHLASWEERALPLFESPAAYDRRSFPPTDEFNAAEVRRKADWSLAKVRDHARETHQRLLESIDRLDDETWLADVPVPDHDAAPRGFVIGMILAGDEHGLFAHDLAHLNDVEAYVRSLSAEQTANE